MSVLQVQGIHHITLNGADRQTSIDFWQDLLGMALIFEQPNLDATHIHHLYFDCGDGRTITVFTDENRKPSDKPLPQPEARFTTSHFGLRKQRYVWPMIG